MYNARNIKKQMSKHENEARKSMRKAGLAVIAAQRMSNLVGGLGNGDGGRRSRKAKERAPAPGAIDSSKLMIDYWRKQNAEVANRKTPEYKNGRKAQVVNAKDRLAVPAGRIVMLRHGDARSWQYGLCTREPHKSAPIARVRLLAVPVVSLPEDLHAVKNSAENTVADEIDIDGKELFDPDPGREYASRFDGETRRVLEKAVNHAVTHMADEEHTGERDRDDVNSHLPSCALCSSIALDPADSSSIAGRLAGPAEGRARSFAREVPDRLLPGARFGRRRLAHTG